MRLPTEQQLFLTYLALIGLVVLTLSVGAESLLRQDIVRSYEDDLQRELALARELYDSMDEIPPDSMARLLGARSGRRVTVVDRQGRLVGEWAGEDLPRIDDYRVRPEIQQALEQGAGRAVRMDPGRSVEYLYAATLTERGHVLRLGRETAGAAAALGSLQRGILGVGALALLLAIVFTIGFRQLVTQPLNRISEAARALAAGDLSRRVRLRRLDQMGDLSSALNALADELQRRLGQLEGERAEMQALIDAMSEGVLAVSAAGTLRRANPAARRMFSLGLRGEGLSPEMISRRPEFLSLVSAALEGETVPPRELSGANSHLVATAHPLPDGGAVLVFLDVSELRRLEGVRRDFVANASHELKTPLTAIRGFSETLAEPDLPPELVRRFAEIVKANADRLQRIVDDLLDLSRIEAGGWRIDPSAIRLADLVEEVWSAHGGEDSKVRLEIHLDPAHETVFADPSGLRQVLTNLFSNALRYTPDGGSITVATREAVTMSGPRRPLDLTAEGHERWTLIEVRDTGSGIPSAHLSRIFERFYRVDPARAREEGGTGLGLSIVKHLIESHGGWIEAESQVGAGTTIRFVLPSSPATTSFGA